MLAADAAFPGFFKGMMVADPAAPNPVQVLTELVSIHPTASLAHSAKCRCKAGPVSGSVLDSILTNGQRRSLQMRPGMRCLQLVRCPLRVVLETCAAGQLGLPVGLMAFKGMAQHSAQLEELLQASELIAGSASIQ